MREASKPFTNLVERFKVPINSGACCVNQFVNCPKASVCHPCTHHIVASSAIRRPVAKFELPLQLSSRVRVSFGTQESKSQSDSELVSATSATTGNVSGNAVKSVSGLPTADSVPELPTANLMWDFPGVNAADHPLAFKDAYHRRAVFRCTPPSAAATETASTQDALRFPVRVLYNSFNVFVGKRFKFETQLPKHCIPAAFKLCPPLTPPACKAGMFSLGTQEALLA